MTSSLSDVSAALDEALQAARGGVALDVHDALQRTGVFGQRFTTSLAAYAQLAECRNVLELAVSVLARPDLKAGATDVVAEQLASHATVFERRINMPRLAAFVQRASAEVAATDVAVRSAAAVTYLECLSDFVFALRFLVSAELPWHELAVAFEGARAINTELAVHAELTLSLPH